VKNIQKKTKELAAPEKDTQVPSKLKPSEQPPIENKEDSQPEETFLTEEMCSRFYDIRDKARDDRLTNWRDKQAQNLFPIKYTSVREKPNANGQEVVKLEQKWNQDDLSETQKYELESAYMAAASGSASRSHSILLAQQTLMACDPGSYGILELYTAIQEIMIAMSPQDEIEGMLCHRLYALNNQAMKFMGYVANPKNTSEVIDLNINRATKLMRLSNETLDALNKHRRKGEQKVTVTHNHVNVNSGGQAVVANEINQQPGRGDDVKK
jgi:hypothetical protein